MPRCGPWTLEGDLRTFVSDAGPWRVTKDLRFKENGWILRTLETREGKHLMTLQITYTLQTGVLIWGGIIILQGLRNGRVRIHAKITPSPHWLIETAKLLGTTGKYL